MKYWLAGGGCYGQDYVRQLLRARERGAIAFDELVVIDHNPSPAVFEQEQPSCVRHHRADWQEVGLELWKQRTVLHDDQWVPPPLAPHILYHWLAAIIRHERGLNNEPVAWPTTAPALPFAEIIREGTLVLSHAPGLCPVHCIEPKRCPLTREDRDWEMNDTVALLAREAGFDHHCSFVCQHHAYGVGTIAMKTIFEQMEAITNALNAGQNVAVATISSCHGIVDALRVSES